MQDTKTDNTQYSIRRTILAAVLILYCLSFTLVLTHQPLGLVGSDYYSRWYATRMLFNEHRSLYDPRNSEEVTVATIEGSFFYPAHLVLITAPMVILPFPIARFLWMLIIQILLLVGVWFVSSIYKWPRSFNHFAILLFASLFFIPNIQNTIWGQFGTISTISLALVLYTLIKEKYVLAGIFTLGLTFKPQVMLLTLTLLLFWSFVDRSRWRYWQSFGLVALASWGIAELLEPNWPASFWRGVQAYSAHHQTISIIEKYIPTNHILEGLLLVAIFAAWVYYRRSLPGSIAFTGCVVLSIAGWWLVVPVLGMMHLVVLPLALILLFAGLQSSNRLIYSIGIIVILILYILGLLGFLYGLSQPGLYGLHIQLAELAYKIVTPVILILLTIPLLLKKNSIVILV